MHLHIPYQISPPKQQQQQKVEMKYFIGHQDGIQNRLCFGPEEVTAPRRLWSHRIAVFKGSLPAGRWDGQLLSLLKLGCYRCVLKGPQSSVLQVVLILQMPQSWGLVPACCFRHPSLCPLGCPGPTADHSSCLHRPALLASLGGPHPNILDPFSPNPEPLRVMMACCGSG